MFTEYHATTITNQHAVLWWGIMRIPRILRTLLEKARILSRSNEDAPLLSSRELAEPLYCAISIPSEKKITLSFDIIAIVSGFLSNDAESLLALRRTSREFNRGVVVFYQTRDMIFPRFSGLTQTLCNSNGPIVLLNNNGSQFIKLGTLEELNIVEEPISAARLLSYLILGMNHAFPRPEKVPVSEEYETQLNDYKKLRYKLRGGLALSLIFFLGSATGIVLMLIKITDEPLTERTNAKDVILGLGFAASLFMLTFASAAACYCCSKSIKNVEPIFPGLKAGANTIQLKLSSLFFGKEQSTREHSANQSAPGPRT